MTSRTSSFRLRELFMIGQGGMGTTWLACASTGAFERLVVVKRLHEHLIDATEARQRLIEEAQLAGYVHHANVVGTHHTGSDERGVFLVLEFIEGCSLRKLLRVRRPERLPEPIVLRIMLDCLSGLSAIHNAVDNQGRPLEILHRDITPENILVGLDGVSRLADFGIAKSARSVVHTAPLQLVGKLPFMPPEYIDRGHLGPPLDIYGLGVSMWRLLAGRPPWPGLEEAQLMVRILTEGVPPLPDDAGVSAELTAVVARACARDANDRYQSAFQMRVALEALRREHPAADHGTVAAYVTEAVGAEAQAMRERAAAALLTGSLPPPSAPEIRMPSLPPPPTVPLFRPVTPHKKVRDRWPFLLFSSALLVAAGASFALVHVTGEQGAFATESAPAPLPLPASQLPPEPELPTTVLATNTVEPEPTEPSPRPTTTAPASPTLTQVGAARPISPPRSAAVPAPSLSPSARATTPTPAPQSPTQPVETRPTPEEIVTRNPYAH